MSNKSASPVRVRDLPDLIGSDGPTPILWCRLCREENSAHRGDYFMAHPDTVFTCCAQPMILVVKSTRYRDATVASCM